MSAYLEQDRESIAQRRARLAADIARQRSEFAVAYRNLHKPIEMGESGLRVLGFMRQNAWIFNAVSTSISTVTFLFGVKEMVTGKSAAKAAAAKERKALEREAERKKSRSLVDHALHWGGHGWRVYKIYNRVKKYLPRGEHIENRSGPEALGGQARHRHSHRFPRPD